MQGIAVYLTPDFSLLTNRQVWIDAFSQIFFTLSLAFGIMIVYASYLPRKVNIVKDALIIGFGNSLFSIFAGLAVFGTLGYMAGQQGVPVQDVVDKAIGLAFVTYPKAISMMPAFSKLFGVMFFTSLVIAGLSSAVSLIEAFSAAIIDKFGKSREAVVSIVCVVGFLLSLVFAARSGLLWLDIIDHFITNYGLVIIAILECVIIGWVFKASKLREHINHSGDINMQKGWDVAIRFIIPIILFCLLGNALYFELKEPYGGSWLAVVLLGRDSLLITLLVAFIFSMRPWKKELEQH